MEATTAFDMAQRGGAVLCLDVPEGTEFGIDLHSWQVGPKFKGVKMVPPGMHLLYYSPALKYGGAFSPRKSIFVHFPPPQQGRGEVKVFRWSTAEEELVPEERWEDQEEALRFKEGVRRFDFDAYLGPYPLQQPEPEEEGRTRGNKTTTAVAWLHLCNYVTPEVVARLQPVGRTIWSQAAEEEEEELQRSGGPKIQEAVEGEEEAGKKEKGRSHHCFYTDMPKRFVPKDATPAVITRSGLDKSYLLRHLLLHQYSKQGGTEAEQEEAAYKLLLGELQFAYLCFLLGQCLDGFLQWKRMVEMLCNCQEALRELPGLFLEFVVVLHHQLKRMPVDFFQDELLQDNFLAPSLGSFFAAVLEEGEAEERLIQRCRKFRRFLTKRFHHDFTIVEPDDEAPQVVSM